MKLSYRSLWLRFALLQFLLLFALLTGVNLLLSTHQKKQAEQDMDKQLQLIAQGMVDLTAALDGRVPAHDYMERLEKLYIDAVLLDEERQKSGYRPLFMIWRSDGTPLYASPGQSLHPLPKGDLTPEWLATNQWKSLWVSDKDHRYRLLAAESRQERAQLLTIDYFALLSFWGIIFIAMMLTAWAIAHFALAPLRNIAREIAGKDPMDLAPLQQGKEYRETRPLVNAINQLMLRQQELDQREKQFLADAAHELRTPIAAISAQLHVYQHSRSLEEQQEVMQEIQHALQRTSSLSRQLIAMARLETEAYLIQLVPCNLVELVRQSMVLCVPLALNKGIELLYDGEEESSCLLDPHAFASVMQNLLDNAIKYHDKTKGRVEVSVRNKESHCELFIRDNGPGVAEAHRVRLFERFFRVPGNVQTGSGLGLAITHKLVHYQGGAIQFCDGLDHQGLGLWLSFPRHQAVT
ncbi:MAG: sensor histidine kinase [Aeromonadaceae bacterium]